MLHRNGPEDRKPIDTDELRAAKGDRNTRSAADVQPRKFPQLGRATGRAITAMQVNDVLNREEAFEMQYSPDFVRAEIESHQNRVSLNR